MPGFYTITQISEKLGTPIHRIRYAIRRFGPRPTARVGITWLWNDTEIPQIRRSLTETAKRSTAQSSRQTAGNQRPSKHGAAAAV